MRIATYLFLLLLCIVSSNVIQSQTPCTVSYKEYFLNANKIKASFLAGGNKFTSNVGPGFFVPYPDLKASTIFASSPWVGGFDDAGNLKVAAETFATISKNDFYPGPLTPVGIPFDIPCEQFDRVWSVFGDDIRHHKEDLWDGMIDDTIASIFGWPGVGNPFFEEFNGFPLPAHTQLAPFRDLNGNGTYDPHEGEYPQIRFNYNFYIPDQILWMVFHDAGPHDDSGGYPLRFEFQLTAFAFNCQDNDLLNHTIFNSYKIYNRAITSADSVFFGFWKDYDLGCSTDDFVGSDSLRSTEFAYNRDTVDGDNISAGCITGANTYGKHPPAQSMTYLSHPMHSFIGFDSFNMSPREKYNLLNGRWRDNSPIVPEGTGNVPGSLLSPTRFLYNGDPRDTAAWAANNVNDDDFSMTVSSVKLKRLDPGAFTIVDLAYMFHQDTALDHLGQIGVMHTNVDSLISSMYNLNENCLPFPSCFGKECVWPGDFDHNGIADHEDLLTWGLMKDKLGKSRNGLISWRGHHAGNWIDTTLDGVNFKHGDGDGNGIIDVDDLYPLRQNYLSTNMYYQPKALYPQGPEISLSSQPLDSNGFIRRIFVRAGTEIPDVFGLAFELEFDTSYFMITGYEDYDCPDITKSQCFFDGPNNYPPGYPVTPKYAFVKTDHQSFDIQEGFRFYRSFFGIRLRPGLVYNDLPDTIRIRLKNLIAIDEEGNDLQIGSNELVFLKNMTTSIPDLWQDNFSIYPNPASGYIHFDIEKEISFQVFNVQGQLKDAFVASPQSKVDVSGYKPGIYFIKAVDTGWVVKLAIH